MTDLITEVVLGAIAALSGGLAIAFIITAIRAASSGRSAYKANRDAMPPSIMLSFRGSLQGNSSNKDQKRTSHGLAIDLKTKKLVPQKQISTEALDDVIGRSV